MASVATLMPPAPAHDDDPRAANLCGLHDRPADAAPASPRFALSGWVPWLSLRLLSGLATVIVISIIVFAATQALPSDPARVILGPEATDAAVALLRHQLGLDRPLAPQYVRWAARAITGDFGISLDSSVPAAQIVAERFRNSLALMAVALTVTLPLAFAAGVALALRRDRWVDRHAITGLILVKAVPGFILGIGLIILFSTSVLPILPAVSLLEPGVPALMQPLYLVLPAATLALTILPFLIRMVRAGMIEVLDAEYITAARLRGLPERRIVWRHAVPNALVPTIQGIAMSVRLLLGGALIVEVVFSYPGMGAALNAAVEMRDIPVIQAITLLMAVSVVLINLLADMLTVLVTPKLRTARSGNLSPGVRARWKLKAGGV